MSISNQQNAQYLDPHPDNLDLSSQQGKVWAICNYHGPLVTKITNLFNKINVKCAFIFCNTINSLLMPRIKISTKYMKIGDRNETAKFLIIFILDKRNVTNKIQRTHKMY